MRPARRLELFCSVINFVLPSLHAYCMHAKIPPCVSMHPLEDLVKNHSFVLMLVNIVGVLCGLKIALNMLWHLRVANTNSGRGVLRIIREQHLSNYYRASRLQ